MDGWQALSLAGALVQPYLRPERLRLDRRLYGGTLSIPSGRPQPTQSGDNGLGQCSIRMLLLTWLSYWLGAGATLFPEGVWPRLTEFPDGPKFKLGPTLDEQHPLLTDNQCIRLLCEGSPFNRAGVRQARYALEDIELDLHNSLARMQAIIIASIFHKWRDCRDGLYS